MLLSTRVYLRVLSPTPIEAKYIPPSIDFLVLSQAIVHVQVWASGTTSINRTVRRHHIAMARSYDTSTTADIIVKDLASHIAGKVILTTGVTPGGLGAFFVEQIAQARPKLVILAGRSTQKLQSTADVVAKVGIPTKTLELDLSSLNHAKQAAATVNEWSDVPVIDVVVNNAGIMGAPYGKTSDGYESQFATNHLGPFLFTNLIMPKVLASQEPRIVTVSSDGHRLSPIRSADYGFHVRCTPPTFHAVREMEAELIRRTARTTTDGPRMASPRLPIC